EVLGMRAREAKALDPLDCVARAQQLAELRFDLGRKIAATRGDVLAEQRQLSHTVCCKPCHLGEDVSRAAAHLASADGGHDAVGALRVASHRDLDPSLEAA